MLNKNKGLVLIEIPIVIAILCILFLISIKCYGSAKKVLAYREEIRKETVIFKSIKKELLYNAGYDNLLAAFKDNETLYINSENLDIDRIINNNITDLFDASINSNNKYIKIQKLNSENTIKVKIEQKVSKFNSNMVSEEVCISRNVR
ncbi:hypothetical protein [Clostridium sp. 'White wine YQ']|uniref:hypothetical protein n=1 Tax=Clostridium sp. 'White wine YQ' TaxID=3027474 RepID=UPI002365C6A5|nr:hypothetical protein [Clostridium sp. 'White wine YQ']MDD7793954.1 hypothetical protein [Clostridium sp. 'White wine YQ']